MTTLSTRAVIYFWLPLAITWLMMSVEGPYVAAIIARLPDAAFNLAAYGVAFAIAWLAEAPIMMMMTAANRLAQDRQSFLAMRRFMYVMCVCVTGVMALGSVPFVFRLVTTVLMTLPPEVAQLTHIAIAILIPWPAAIAYRRFYQGVLVRHRMPRRVAYGTVIRLTAMSVTGATLAFTTSMHGATIGSIALVIAVITEAIASRWMARHIVASILTGPAESRAPLTRRAIAAFYYPLALTSIISMAVGPLLTLFAGRGRMPIESLAVLPVVQGVVFMFRSGGVAFQEVGVALTGQRGEHAREVRRAALVLGAASVSALALLLFTPLAGIWLRGVSGLSPDLAEFALLPARLLAIHPMLDYLLAFQRSRFILSGATRAITIATVLEVSGIALVLWVCIGPIGTTGAVAASIALVAARFAANAYLATARVTTP